MKTFSRNKKAQQIIEYLLVVGAVVTTLLLFTRAGGPFREAVRRVLNESAEQVNRQTERVCVGADCKPSCGNGICDYMAGETCETCPEDCHYCQDCGDGYCGRGENCWTCPSDCGTCSSDCGNGICEPSENYLSCPEDCGGMPQCGNGRMDGEEECDAGEFVGGFQAFRSGEACSEYGDFYEECGSLSCYPMAAGEELMCTVNTVNCCFCGNNKLEKLEGGELCDKTKLDGKTCADVFPDQHVEGTLLCNDTCDGYDTSGCFVCGDGEVNVEAGERCDPGADGQTPQFAAGVECENLDEHYGGTDYLGCDENCQVVYDDCPRCGNGKVEDEFEDCEAGVDEGLWPSCHEYDSNYDCGDIGCQDCKWDTMDCGRCGDNKLNCPGEECDGDDWALNDEGEPMSYEDFGFDGGELRCYPEGHEQECQFDLSGLSGCGDGICTEEEKDECEIDCGCWYEYAQGLAWAACRTPASPTRYDDDGYPMPWDVYCLPRLDQDRDGDGVVDPDGELPIQQCELINYSLHRSGLLACHCAEGERPVPIAGAEESMETLWTGQLGRRDDPEEVFMQYDLYHISPPDEWARDDPPFYICEPFVPVSINEDQTCCGDGIINGDELCEPVRKPDVARLQGQYPHQLNGQRCPDMDPPLGDIEPPETLLQCWGTLAYNVDGEDLRCTFNTTGCLEPSDLCGNGDLDDGEECDPASRETLPPCPDGQAGVVLCYGAGTDNECTYNYEHCGDGSYPNGTCDCYVWEGEVCVAGEMATPWLYPEDCGCTVLIETLNECSACLGDYCEDKDSSGQVPWISAPGTIPCVRYSYPFPDQRCACGEGTRPFYFMQLDPSSTDADCDNGVYAQKVYHIQAGYECIPITEKYAEQPGPCCGDGLRNGDEDCEGADLGDAEVCGDLPQFDAGDNNSLSCHEPLQDGGDSVAECTYDISECGAYCREKDGLAVECDGWDEGLTQASQPWNYYKFGECPAEGQACAAYCPEDEKMVAMASGCECEGNWEWSDSDAACVCEYPFVEVVQDDGSVECICPAPVELVPDEGWERGSALRGRREREHVLQYNRTYTFTIPEEYRGTQYSLMFYCGSIWIDKVPCSENCRIGGTANNSGMDRAELGYEDYWFDKDAASFQIKTINAGDEDGIGSCTIRLYFPCDPPHDGER